MCNIAFVWYMFIFSIMNISTGTNAIFTDQALNSSTFQSKSWVWDKSSLEFTNQFGGNCNEIYSFIKNSGSGDMIVSSKYYVYFHPTDDPVNPKKLTGELVYQSGVIPKMVSKGEPEKLIYKPLKAGKYKFVVFQHPKKPSNNGENLTVEGTAVTFSETINVSQCQDK